jgi:CheY-like chemotaxis protein
VARRLVNPDNTRRLKQRRRTILCIDDDAIGSALRKALLERAGYRVLIAGSGTQGLEMAKCHRIDLVLVDFEMPDMHGVAVVGLLRCIQPKKRIVMLSGHESQALRGFRELDGFISKSTRIDLLVACVTRHLSR